MTRHLASLSVVVAVLTSANVAHAQNLPPVGFHDGNEGGQHNFVCTAHGFAVDPDDRDADVEVRIVANDTIVATSVAGRFRPDLETNGICPGGTCAFTILLWGQITPLVPYRIVVEARDTATGAWTALAGSPRMVRCFAFTMTVFDFTTREARVVSHLPYVAGHFGPNWSPDGHEVVYNVVGWRTFPTDFITQLHITNLETGATHPIEGTECGGNAAWSPDGRRMVFEVPCGVPGLYLGRPRGGPRRMLRPGGGHPDWSPDGHFVVFAAADGLRTIHVASGRESLLAEEGFRPAWSPDGRWIAFQRLDGNIWKIRVTPWGTAGGPPRRLTGEPLLDGRPAWSSNSRRIYFHTETRTFGMGHPLDDELHVWQMSASGHRQRNLTRLTGMGVDLASWRNGRRLAYGGSPLR